MSQVDLTFLILIASAASLFIAVVVIDRHMVARRIRTHGYEVVQVTILYPRGPGGQLDFQRGGWVVRYKKSQGVERSVLCRSGICGRYRPLHRQMSEEMS